MMDLGTPNDHDNDSEGDDGDGDGDDSEWQEQQQDESPCPHTPEGSPPPSSSPSPKGRAKDKTTPKEVFKKALSKLVVRCLDHHRKPDCKYGRITCSEDFKYLARKLTLGITTKEVNRKGSGDLLIFTDQVKSRTKDYIKNYMKKFGPIYNNS
jgi:histone-lysine N-methyltransferase SETD2